MLYYKKRQIGETVMERTKTAIIIGAGPAGLTAAYELLTKSNDIKPIILELETFVGGISRTATYKGRRMDIGGHRFFSKDERVNELWKTIFDISITFFLAFFPSIT